MPLETFKYSFKNNWDINDIPTDNLVSINNRDYFLGYLDPERKTHKGGHSRIFALYDAQDFESETDHIPSKVLKISKYCDFINNNKTKISYSRNNRRFWNEVSALDLCKTKNYQNIIEIETSGYMVNQSIDEEKYQYFPYYIMEYAECDLKNYIETIRLTINERIKLCLHIAQGLKQLEELGYYHRDLKPDNILFVDNNWKIGDLGLISSRYSDSIDDCNEVIGPRGWMTPEAMNKYLTEEKGFQYKFDCIIDHQSDIFQLGKVFWYIIQGNAPIGCIKTIDFRENDIELYALLRTMLNHSKKKRYKHIDEVITILKRISEKMY